MTLLLAQLPDPSSAQSIGWLALAVFAVFGGVNQVLRFVDRFKANPPLHQTYASTAALQKVEGEHKAELGRVEVDLKQAIGDLAKLVREEAANQAYKRKGIYQTIEKLGQDMAATRAINEGQTRQMHSLETKLENVRDQITRNRS